MINLYRNAVPRYHCNKAVDMTQDRIFGILFDMWVRHAQRRRYRYMCIYRYASSIQKNLLIALFCNGTCTGNCYRDRTTVLPVLHCAMALVKCKR